MHTDTLSAHIESVLFATEKPMSRKSMETLFEASSEEIDTALRHLENSLDGRGVTLIEADHNVTLRTVPQASSYITKMRNDELSQELGKAGLETLAIILYRDGAYRSEIDWIRGVRSSATIRSLSMRGLIEGTPDTHNKRRIHYRATIDALSHLGIAHIEELPRYDELTRALSNSEEATETVMLP